MGRLCIAGDWACVHGDLPELIGIAERLVEHAREPPYEELATLSALCLCDPTRVVEAWYGLKELVRTSGARP